MGPNYNLRDIRNQAGKSSSDRINHLKHMCAKINKKEKSIDNCCITSTRILRRNNKQREDLVVKTYCCNEK